MMAINGLATTPIVNWGSDELKARYLPRVATGEWQASYCLSEADAGSDVAAMTARADRDGDSLRPQRHASTGSPTPASPTSTWCSPRPIRRAGARGVSCFLVERDHGLRIGKLERKMGMHGSPTGEVVLDDVRIPAANLIGEEGQGFSIAMHTLDRSRPSIAAQAVGIAQGALDYAVGYVKERKAFGQPDRRVPGSAVHAGRHGDEDRGGPGARPTGPAPSSTRAIRDGELNSAGAMAKAFASDVAMEVTTNGVQLLGGYGYTMDFPMERFMRDAKITQIYEGTNQIQRVVIARNLLK